METFTRVISADSHVLEPSDLWLKTIGAKFGDRTPRVMDEWRGEKGRFFWTGNQVRRLMDVEKDAATRGGIEAGYLPEKRVEFQKDCGVDAELMYTTQMLAQMRSRDPEVLRAAITVYNDWLDDFCSYDKPRLVPIALIPMHDVDWAVRELDRNLARGFKGAMINLLAPSGCAPYRDAAYDPFWARASEAGIPVTLHSGTGSYDDPFHFGTDKEREESPSVLMDGYNEIMNVLARDFIFGGILDRFPTLKLVSSEFEISWIPYFMFRLEQMQDAMAHRMRLRKLKERAIDYMRRRIWHGIIDDKYAEMVIPVIGASQILWGSDYPHVRSVTKNTPGVLARHFQALPGPDQHGIVGRNVAALYGL